MIQIILHRFILWGNFTNKKEDQAKPLSREWGLVVPGSEGIRNEGPQLQLLFQRYQEEGLSLASQPPSGETENYYFSWTGLVIPDFLDRLPRSTPQD